MDTATEKVTDRQRHRLNQLLLSSVFTAEEAHRIAIWLNSPRATKEKASAEPNTRRIKTMAVVNIPPPRYSKDYPPANGKSATETPPEDTPTPAPARKDEDEPKIYRINGVEYTDKNEAAAATSKAILG